METTETESPTTAAAANGAAHQAAPPAAKAPSGARRPLIILTLIALLAGGGYVTHAYLTKGQEETEDAQVESDVVPLAARTGGLILHVRVRENQVVNAGDVILEIDRAETEARVAQAEAGLATARAQEAAAQADVNLVNATARGGFQSANAAVTGAVDAVRSSSAQVAAAEAGVARARAQASQTRTTLTRTRSLHSEGAIAQAELDNAQSMDDAAQAAVVQAEAQVLAARAAQQSARSQIGQAQGRLEQSAPVDTQLAVAHAKADLAHAQVESAVAALALARLQLSYTTVTAPTSGLISRLTVHEGQLLQMSQAIAELVPTDTYLVANFKETQIGRMRAGNRADIEIDAFPGRTFEGVVESLSGGTGARFSLLPPDNASGNFVKVVQRVPVRIRWLHPPTDVALRAGLSATVTVHVDQQVAAH